MTTTSHPKPATKLHPELTMSGGTAPTKGHWVAQIPRHLFWIAVSLVAAVFILEFLFSLVGAGEEEYIKLDPVLGIVHLENKAVTFRSEGYSREKTSLAGHRDFDHALTKSPDVVRIAFLGDSKTEAFQVPINESFARMLEKRLNSAGGQRVEVLNFAMAGYSTGQEYFQYLQQVSPYQPDITVLMYNILDNDENTRPVVVQDAAFPRPYFSVDSAGTLITDWTVLDQYLHGTRANVLLQTDWLRRNSHIWGVFTRLDSNLKADKTYKPIGDAIRSGLSLVTSKFASHKPASIYAKQTNQIRDSLVNEAKQPTGFSAGSTCEVSPAKVTPNGKPDQSLFSIYLKSHNAHFNVTSSLIKRLAASCKARNSRLIVAALPAPSNSTFYCRELIGLNEICKQSGADFINLHEQFPAMEPGKPHDYLIQSHFSTAGHRYAATLLYPTLAREVANVQVSK